MFVFKENLTRVCALTTRVMVTFEKREGNEGWNFSYICGSLFYKGKKF